VSSGIVFVFPGQGAQAVGMGRDLYDNFPEARAAFEAVDAACGAAISELCFNGPEEALKQTENTQPALFATSVAALAACRAAGLTPAAAAGHSIGEYAALYAAGVFSLEDGARLVRTRAQAMALAAAERPGAMAAVLGADFDAVDAACREVNPVGVVVPANVNAPGQVVISGETRAVEAAGALLKERGAAKRVVPLAVSGAFHSPLMRHATETMTGALAGAALSDPALPVIANVTADYERTAGEVRENLVAQVAGPVRWVETIQRFAADGYDTFVECGPGAVLAGLIKRIAPEAKTFSVGDAASLAAAKEALGGA
jgi:malonyl CoA-acyl carrier protein transacylase